MIVKTPVNVCPNDTSMVEDNAERMVAACRDRNVAVDVADALNVLAAMSDGSHMDATVAHHDGTRRTAHNG